MLFNASNARNTRKLHQRNRHLATDNFNVEKLVCRIHENGAQNLQVTGEEFSLFLPQKSDNPSYATLVPVVHLFSNTYPTHASLLQALNQ